jgi:hypothetical protein
LLPGQLPTNPRQPQIHQAIAHLWFEWLEKEDVIGRLGLGEGQREGGALSQIMQIASIQPASHQQIAISRVLVAGWNA